MKKEYEKEKLLLLNEMIFLFFFLLLFDKDKTLADEKLFFALIVFYVLFVIDLSPQANAKLRKGNVKSNT